MGLSGGIYVIFGNFFDLDARVLGVDLTFYEIAKDLWSPDIETDLAAGGDDFKGKMFLDTFGIF